MRDPASAVPFLQNRPVHTEFRSGIPPGLLNDKSRMKGDFHVRFREKFEVKVLLLTRLRGRELITPSYSITYLDIPGTGGTLSEATA